MLFDHCAVYFRNTSPMSTQVKNQVSAETSIVFKENRANGHLAFRKIGSDFHATHIMSEKNDFLTLPFLFIIATCQQALPSIYQAFQSLTKLLAYIS